MGCQQRPNQKLHLTAVALREIRIKVPSVPVGQAVPDSLLADAIFNVFELQRLTPLFPAGPVPGVNSGGHPR